MGVARVPAAVAGVERRGDTTEEPSGCCGCSRVEGEQGPATCRGPAKALERGMAPARATPEQAARTSLGARGE